MSETEKDELIDAQKQVIGILFEVIKRLQTNNDLDEEYFQIITDSTKNEKRIKEILDERNENSSASRGFVEGKRADVIIIGLINETNDNHYLLSIPRDTLIMNSCTKNLERINGSYSKNECGNNAENLAAAQRNNLLFVYLPHRFLYH